MACSWHGVAGAAFICRIVVNGEHGGTVSGDPELLRRAVENILRNAIRYAPNGSDIDVRIDNHNASTQISVRDDGPGVPEDALPRLSQPFFRADDSRDSATGGVGLGLAIAQRAIHLHHGLSREQPDYHLSGARHTIAPAPGCGLHGGDLSPTGICADIYVELSFWAMATERCRARQRGG